MNAVYAFLLRFVDQPDKVLHAAVGALLALAGMWAASEAEWAPVPAMLAVLWAGTLIAWGKERYDKSHPLVHTWDGWDAFATVVGVCAGLTLFEAIHR